MKRADEMMYVEKTGKTICPGIRSRGYKKSSYEISTMGDREIDLCVKKKKISLRKIILLLMILGCLTSAVAIILTSYSSLQLMNQNIEDNMKMNLYQFTKESDEACYKLLRVLNQMSADGMVGSAVDKYLTQEEHYDQYVNKKNLRVTACESEQQLAESLNCILL